MQAKAQRQTVTGIEEILGNMNQAIKEKREALGEKEAALKAMVEAAEAEIGNDKEGLAQMEADRTVTKELMFVIGKRWIEPVRRLF